MLCKALVIHLPKEVKMLIHQSPQVGGLGIAWALQWQRLAAGKSQDQAHPEGQRRMTFLAQRRAPDHWWRGNRRETANRQCSDSAKETLITRSAHGWQDHAKWIRLPTARFGEVYEPIR